MSATVKIKYTKATSQLEAIEEWLYANAGVGSSRFGGREGTIKHWLNGDDWLYYGEYPIGADALEDTDYVFVFRDEQVATEFALRFA